MTKKKKAAAEAEASPVVEADKRPKLVKNLGLICKELVRSTGRRLLSPEELPGLHQKIKDGYTVKLEIGEELKRKVAEMKEIKDRLKTAAQEVDENLAYISMGSRPEMRCCLQTKDFTAGRCVTIDAGTGEVYEDREIRSFERQGGLNYAFPEHDCQHCKYADCSLTADDPELCECPEHYKDCFQCSRFSCALAGRCDNPKYNGDGDHFFSTDKDAAALDCFFCQFTSCLGEASACYRRSDCSTCESFRCEAGKKQIEDGFCKMADKAVTLAFQDNEQQD